MINLKLMIKLKVMIKLKMRMELKKSVIKLKMIVTIRGVAVPDLVVQARAVNPPPPPRAAKIGQKKEGYFQGYMGPSQGRSPVCTGHHTYTQ